MRLRKPILALITSLLLATSNAQAEGWCTFQPGWQVVTHGTVSDTVWILGRLVGSTNDIWMYIADPNIGKTNVALAISAQIAGKDISVYLREPTATCANYANGSPMGSVLHIRIL